MADDEKKMKVLRARIKASVLYVGETISIDVDAQLATNIKAMLNREKVKSGKVFTTSLMGNKLFITRQEDEPER